MIEVSIIMPCHNGSKYLQEAIDSVVNQSYKDWELLVIDDNSSDNSLSIIKKYTSIDSRIILLENPNPTGKPATPRNVGIKAAKGRYIAFLDCDDTWMKSKLEVQLAAFDDYTSIVFSYYKKMDENSNEMKNVIKSPRIVKYNQLLDGNCIGNLTGIYDTKKVGKVFQKELFHEDYVMWLEILKEGFHAKNTGTLEASYRENKKSISGNKFLALTWTWSIFRKELKMPLILAVYHFFRYSIRGILKFVK